MYTTLLDFQDYH